MKLSRLWQPRRLLFWQMVGFNVLSSVCTWAMRAFPLNTGGLLLLAVIALLNVLFGLLAAWRLMQDEPAIAPLAPDQATLPSSRSKATTSE